ncbi:MAG: DNA primase [Sulfuricaulis sp.]
MNADRILERLDGARQTAPRQWVARCPAHEDRSPSLSIRELPDGKVLLHDFGGCDCGDVLAAIGLELSDLFPEKPADHRSKPNRAARQWDFRALLKMLEHEMTVVFIVANDLANGRVLTPETTERLHMAAGRIAKIAGAAG